MNTTNKKQPKFIKDLGMQYPKPTSKKKRHYWLMECPLCDKEYKTERYSVLSGKNIRCVSCAAKISSTKHGWHNTNLYAVWNNMKNRCLNENHKSYKNYGERGISICDEWRDFVHFRNWALENGYSKELSIDRINNDGNYEPLNCRWTTQTTQNRNTVKIQRNNKSGYRGVCWDKKKRKWMARIGLNNKGKFLGYFDDKIDAAKAYDKYVIINDLEHTINFDR